MITPIVTHFLERECAEHTIRKSDGTTLYYNYGILAEWIAPNIIAITQYRLSSLGFQHQTINAVEKTTREVIERAKARGILIAKNRKI